MYKNKLDNMVKEAAKVGQEKMIANLITVLVESCVSYIKAETKLQIEKDYADEKGFSGQDYNEHIEHHTEYATKRWESAYDYMNKVNKRSIVLVGYYIFPSIDNPIEAKRYAKDIVVDFYEETLKAEKK